MTSHSVLFCPAAVGFRRCTCTVLFCPAVFPLVEEIPFFPAREIPWGLSEVFVDELIVSLPVVHSMMFSCGSRTGIYPGPS
jgi:hypothetical protein